VGGEGVGGVWWGGMGGWGGGGWCGGGGLVGGVGGGGGWGGGGGGWGGGGWWGGGGGGWGGAGGGGRGGGGGGGGGWAFGGGGGGGGGVGPERKQEHAKGGSLSVCRSGPIMWRRTTVQAAGTVSAKEAISRSSVVRKGSSSHGLRAGYPGGAAAKNIRSAYPRRAAGHDRDGEWLKCQGVGDDARCQAVGEIRGLLLPHEGRAAAWYSRIAW